MTTRAVIDVAGLDALVRALRAEGYTVIGPTVRDGAIVLAELASAAELPAGWSSRTSPGRYRLERRGDAAVFAGHSAGPGSWKAFLHPPRRRLLTVDRDGDAHPDLRPDTGPQPRQAFLGVHPCDLAAIGILDRVLAGGRYPDPQYTARRDGVFVVVANCTEPGDACFCVSMGGGPRAGAGYDLALTERPGDRLDDRLDDEGHRFLVEAASPAGERILAALPHRPAVEADVTSADADLAAAAGRMGRRMPDVDLRQLLADSRESPHWADVASRCLACGNCTMVCPTCFCTTTEDVTDLTGDHAERWERWDSCFTLDFSYMHGGEVRSSTASRYRQWLSHKLDTWHDQFGGSGCVGCGRCLVWCPVGIDITAETARLAAERAPAEGPETAGEVPP